ncbi:TPA: lipase family protein [Morganella morganii]
MQPDEFKSVQYNDPYCADCSKFIYWIECILVDELNKPLINMPYKLKVLGSTTREGITDGKGYFREENLPRTLAILTLPAQKLIDEMEKRHLRTLRGEINSIVKTHAKSKGYSFHYAVIGELCDKNPEIKGWDQSKLGLPHYHFPRSSYFNGFLFLGTVFNNCHIIEICPFRSWKLLLHHTTNYSIVNAMNLGVLADLSYEQKYSIENFFYKECFDLRKTPIINDLGSNTVVVDVPFSDRYKTVKFLDTETVEEGSTQLFYIESNDEVIVSFRGTQEVDDFITDAKFRPVPEMGVIKSGSIHYGFNRAYDIARYYFKKEFNEIESAVANENKKLYVSGHSLGGAISLIYSIYMEKYHPILYTYGMPRLLTRDAIKSLGEITHYRHVNDSDVVTSLPPEADLDNERYDKVGVFAGLIDSVGQLVNEKIFGEGLGDPYLHHGSIVIFLDCDLTYTDYTYTTYALSELPMKPGNNIRAIRRSKSAQLFIATSLNNQCFVDAVNNQIDFIKCLSEAEMDELFPKGMNPRLKSLPSAAKHSMSQRYIKILNNQLVELVDPNRDLEYKSRRIDFEDFILKSNDSPYVNKSEILRNLDLLSLHKLMPLSIYLTDTDEVGKKSLIRFKQVSKEM